MDEAQPFTVLCWVSTKGGLPPLRGSHGAGDSRKKSNGAGGSAPPNAGTSGTQSTPPPYLKSRMESQSPN